MYTSVCGLCRSLHAKTITPIFSGTCTCVSHACEMCAKCVRLWLSLSCTVYTYTCSYIAECMHICLNTQSINAARSCSALHTRVQCTIHCIGMHNTLVHVHVVPYWLRLQTLRDHSTCISIPSRVSHNVHVHVCMHCSSSHQHLHVCHSHESRMVFH